MPPKGGIFLRHSGAGRNDGQKSGRRAQSGRGPAPVPGQIQLRMAPNAGTIPFFDSEDSRSMTQTAATLAFVFPGQGSQSVGMLAELAAAHPEVKATFDEASQGAGADLWALSQQGPEEDLNRTENTQPALLAASVAVWR